jgi:hypothetical protein
MNGHLTTEQLQAFHGCTLGTEDLVRADAHLAQCADCRTALSNKTHPAAVAAHVKSLLREPTHLQYEEMEAYLDATSLPEARAMVEAHIGTCDRCARELSDLRAFTNMPAQLPAELVAAVRAHQAAQRGWLQNFLRTPAYRIGMIVAIIAAAIGIVGYSTRTPVPATQEQLNITPNTTPATVLPSTTLKDGPRQISVGPGTEIHGLGDFPAAYRKRISDALLAEHFEMPSAAEAARAQQELASARTAFPDSHLLLGVLELQAGHLDTAHSEFAALAQENPTSPTAIDLLRKVSELER